MRVLIDIRKENLDAYPYKTTKLLRLYMPSIDPENIDNKSWDFFGINDSYFGGNIHRIASVKGKPFYLIVDVNDNTLGILHRFDDLKDYDKKDLVSLCQMQKIDITDKDTKQTILDKLTALKS